jgi:AAA+ ATPase superfamily predicted ATPase
MSAFIGRKRELEALKGLLRKDSASLVVIRGRRRIGKSRLAEEFSKSFPKSYTLSGIPPEEGVTAQDQRAEFLRQLQEYRLPIYSSEDWGSLFFELAKHAQKGRVLIVLDEITWMGSKDPTFLPKLKTAWDRHFKKNPHLVLILSGSNSAWIHENILSSTGFFGRISLRILLEELTLAESNAFWQTFPPGVSSYEKFKILSITGGIPRYLEELRPDLSAEQNLKLLCFTPEGLLFNEFDQIFHDLFGKRGKWYKEIISLLASKKISQSELASKLERSSGGDLSLALDELVESGFLARDYTWSLDKASKLAASQYRVRDNYVRFYIKYIFPHKPQVESGQLQSLPPGWYSILGLQFENLVINNGATLRQTLGISPDEVVFAGPYLQTHRTRRMGCQVDYMIQTKFHCLYVCEIKFRQSRVGYEAIEEMKNVLTALKLPRGFSVRPILIHVNGVEETVIDSGFFARIVDFSEFLL